MPEPERMPNWTCKVCKKRMSIEHGQIHLSGSLHAKNLEALRGKEPQKEANIPAWTCKICNITANIGSLESHQAGKRHHATIEANKTRGTPKVKSPSTPVYTPKPLPTNTTSVNSLIKGSQDSADLMSPDKEILMACLETEPKWRTCPACNTTMYAEALERHQAGKCTGSRTVIEFRPPAGEDPVGKKELNKASVDRQKGYDAKVKSWLGRERIKRVRS